MSKLSNFLHLKIYRQTFLLYLVIVLTFVTIMIFVFYSNMQSSTMEPYVREAEAAFSQVERQLDSITDSIDHFFTHLYATASLRDDFFHFFGATPEEYAQSRLNTSYPLYETYLTSCNSLISESEYCIRHIIYYSTSNIVDMEYSTSGYSRYRIIDLETAEALCQTGYLYTKDIHQGSSYVGKASFVMDLTKPVAQAFCTQPEAAAFLLVNSTCLPLGNPDYHTVPWQALLSTGVKQGRTSAPGAGPSSLLYTVQISERYSYSVISIAPAKAYTTDRLYELILWTVGLILVFVLITLLYARQFSHDSLFIQSILHSLVEAQSGNFTPLDIGHHQDEFAAIATHLNSLYQYLDTLIQQKYKLTIRQQRTEMQMLSAQLNPHFLYNTLERIRLRALLEGSPTVAEATADLGLLYRNIVKTEPIITLKKELEITRQYLDLMCFLYDDQFLYHCDIPEDMYAISTPKIWMQPIVENFFKHNFQNDSQLKVVVISGSRQSDGILFQFFDNIGHIREEQIALLNQQFTPEKSKESADTAPGIGLQNVYDRLYLYYGNRVEMRIQNHAPAGVCIQILLKNEVTT